MTQTTPPTPRRASPRIPGPHGTVRLLLAVPLLVLVAPWLGADGPRLFGMPFFYWFQLACIPIEVACMAIVCVTTRDPAARGDGPDRPQREGER